MPRTLTFPPPSPHVCPVCDVRLAGVPCPTCGADLRRPEGAELGQVDHELHRLTVVRGVLVERLLAPGRPSATAPTPRVSAAPPAPPVPPPPVPPPPVAAPAAGGGQAASRWSVAEILVGLGGLSLVAAVVVFAAVAWSDLAAWAQGGLLVAATGTVLAAAVACRRRSLVATAESLGVVSFVLALADVEMVRTALDGTVSGRTAWSIGLAAVATGALAVGRRVGLGGLGAAGAAAAFLPMPLLVAGATSSSPLAWVLAAQSLVAAAVLSTRPAGALDRSILTIGASLSWTVAVGLATGEAADALANSSGSVPAAASLLLAGLAAGSIAVGLRTRVRSLATAGALLGFVPAVLVVADLGAPSWVASALVVQAAVGIAAGESVRRWERTPERELLRGAAHVGAGMSAAIAAATAAVLGVDAAWFGPETVSRAAVTTFLGLASVATAGAVFARWNPRARATVLVGAVASVFAAAWMSGVADDGDTTVTVLMATGGVLAVGCAALTRLDRGRPWSAPFLASAVAVAALALVPLAAIGAAGGAMAEVAVPPLEAGASTSIRDHLAAAASADADALPSSNTVAQLAAAASVGMAGLLVRRRWGAWTVAGVVIALLLAGPVVVGAPIGMTALLLAVGVVAANWCLVVRPDDIVGIVALASQSALLLAVSVASAPLLVGATILISGALSLLAHRSLVAAASSAPLWVPAALVAGLGGLTIDALRLGSARSGPAIAVGLAAAVASTVGPAIERRFRDDAAATCADVVTGAALVVAVLATRSLDAASGLVALVGLVAGVQALRPTRRPLLGVALAASVLLTWMRLSAADVTMLEAYSLPLAGALLVAGALVRPADHSSWVRNGAGLVAALVPTATLAVADGDVARTVATVLASAAVALYGAMQREQAPLAIGATVLAAIAVRHLGPVANELPRYVVFAVAGVTLLAAGATLEQRRRDLRRVRDAFAELR